MDFKQIMAEITSGLTGNFKEDYEYLQNQMEKYKEHPLGKEILRACGRIIAENTPKELKERISRAFNNDYSAYEQTIEEAKFNMYKRDFDKALRIIEPLAKDLDECNLFGNDSESEYFTFDNQFEEIMYKIMKNPTRTVRRAGLPFAEVYFIYGNLLFEMKRYDEAAVTLDKAMRWNPMSANIAFERAEIAKVKGCLDEFLERTKIILEHAYEPLSVAHCYRSFAYYFVEKELWDAAKSCLIMSLQYEPDNKTAVSEMYYIENSASCAPRQLSFEELMQILGDNGIDVSATNDVLSIAFSLGKHFMDNEIYEGAVDMFQIVYNMTQDEEIKVLLADAEAKFAEVQSSN